MGVYRASEERDATPVTLSSASSRLASAMMQSRDLDMVAACRREVRPGGRQEGGRGKGAVLEGVGKGIRGRGAGTAGNAPEEEC